MCKGHIFYSKFVFSAVKDKCSITHTGRHFLNSCPALILLLKYSQDIAGRECFILWPLQVVSGSTLRWLREMVSFKQSKFIV